MALNLHGNPHLNRADHSIEAVVAPCAVIYKSCACPLPTQVQLWLQVCPHNVFSRYAHQMMQINQIIPNSSSYCSGGLDNSSSFLMSVLYFHVKWNFTPFTRHQILFIIEIIFHDLGYGVGLGMFEVTLLYLDISFKIVLLHKFFHLSSLFVIFFQWIMILCLFKMLRKQWLTTLSLFKIRQKILLKDTVFFCLSNLSLV